MRESSRLVVFTRYPIHGSVKTRLISVLGNEGAASLHDRLTRRVLKISSAFAGKAPGALEVRADGGSLSQMKGWLGEDFNFVPQGEGDVGRRMARAFHENFEGGGKRIVLVGTDIPGLTLFHFRAAFDALKKNDVVLGPALDGGYWLIGLRRDAPGLFRGIDWGTGAVYARTVERAAAEGLRVASLPPLQDVDRPEDLRVWENSEAQFLSVVIPTLNEEKNLRSALESAGEVPRGEVIVADGGSEDGTLRIAREWGAKIVRSNPGRGAQMNAGAEAASGSILLFLHADCRLPPNFAGLIRTALRNPRIAGGCFVLRFQPRSGLIGFIETTANWRARLFRLPFGDQAIFVPAPVFRLIGRYAEIPLMEDVEFVRRLRRTGKLAILPAPVVTSSRKYVARGVLRTTWKNKAILLSYNLGVSPERLARFYYGKRKATGAADSPSGREKTLLKS